MDDVTFTPGPTSNTVRPGDGSVLTAPEGWALLPPGDARADPPGESRWGALVSRRRWAAGCSLGASGRRRRPSTVSGPNWRPSGPPKGYARKQEAASRRREEAQSEYVEDFHGAVVAFLAFHPGHADLADRLDEPSPSMPRLSAVARSPGRSVSPSRSGPRPP